MKRLCDIDQPLEEGREGTDVTGAVWDILRASGLRPSRVAHASAQDCALELDIEFSEPTVREKLEVANRLLERFADSAPSWRTETETRTKLVLRRVEPSDEFELLDIAHREDSYTTLLMQALRVLPTFRRGFLESLGLDSAATDWSWSARRALTRDANRSSVSTDGRTKDVPDLVGVSRASQVFIVVENKVFASEGHGQTLAYSDPAFLAGLATQHGITNPRVRLVYLTPDGTAPAPCDREPRFEPMSYDRLVPLLPEAGGTPLTRLLGTLRRRIEERLTWPEPEDQSLALSYLAVQWGLVTPAHVFARLCRAVQPQGFIGHALATSNNQNGLVVYKQLTRPGWERRPEPTRPRGRTIHFELQWSPGMPELRVHLHQETIPYVKLKALKAGHAFLADHRREKAGLRSALHSRRRELEDVGWEFRGGGWAHATARFDEDITVRELRTKLGHLLSGMGQRVDAAVRELD